MTKKKILLIREKLIRRSLENFCLRQKFRDDSFFSTPMASGTCLFLLSLILATAALAETWDCGTIQNTVSCTLDETGTFTVSGSGEMKDYGYKNWGNDEAPSSKAPWGQSREAMAKITNIVIADTVTKIGDGAFAGATKLLNVSMPGVISVGEQAFRDAYRLQEVNMPKVETLENNAFGWNVHLRNVYAPKLKTIGNYAFDYSYDLEYAEFAYNVSFGVGVFSGHSGLEGCNKNLCYECGDKYFKRKVGCVSSCGESFRLNDGECDRIRYTPAEAAKVLHDDNTNSVTITFKK